MGTELISGLEEKVQRQVSEKIKEVREFYKMWSKYRKTLNVMHGH